MTIDINKSYKDFSKEEIEQNKKFLELLSEKHPTIQKACTEIINLNAILQLPKGTEHFITDVHGAHDIFSHLLRSGSGVIKRRINTTFGNEISRKEKAALATLIYYPTRKMKYVEQTEKDMEDWYVITLQRLARIARVSASKYTRSKVRKSMPKDYRYIIDELLHEQHENNKIEYFEEIIRSIIDIDRAQPFIAAICHFIQRLTIDKLHIVGDIYDRGPNPEKVMEDIAKHHDVDIQWGNHDIVWMGAAIGMKVYIATVLRICARYDNLDTIEEAYGIGIRPLFQFAAKYYAGDPCNVFTPKSTECKGSDLQLLKQVSKAITVIQFKLEAEIIQRNPQFEMDDRLLLDKIDYEKGTIKIEGKEYEMLDSNFPTIDPKNPYALTKEEAELMDVLQAAFIRSELLKKHIKTMYAKGSMYLVYNSNLLYHACIPMTADGEFAEVNVAGEKLKGKALMDELDSMTRRAHSFQNSPKNQINQDYLWYLWCGPLSPLFGKQKMATFERYFIADKITHEEVGNPYFAFRDNEQACDKILREFGLDPQESHIVTGHVPVKPGEEAMKANGKLFVIDGGMSPTYYDSTEMHGYTLIYNSYGLLLVAHEQIESIDNIIKNDLDVTSAERAKKHKLRRKRVADTDNGRQLQMQVYDLKMLLAGYRKGIIREKI